MANTSPAPISLDLGLQGTHVLITGGAGLIGSVVVSAFLTAGAHVSSLDLSHAQRNEIEVLEHAQGTPGRLIELHADISSQESLTGAWHKATHAFGTVQTCVALASLDLSVLPQSASLCDMDPATWQRVFNVNINGTFLTCQLWLQGVRDAVQAGKVPALGNISLVVIGSVSGHFGTRTMAAYAAGKSAVQHGLVQSLRADAPRIYAKARVNAVAPGTVDTPRFAKECEEFGEDFRWRESQATTALAVAVPPESVARTILYLASDRWSGHVHGQILNVDSGTSGMVMWSKEEIAQGSAAVH